MTEGYITPERARRELGEDAYWAFRSWLKNKGYDNLTPHGDNKLINDVFATKAQLEEFIKEVVSDFKGNQPTETLWGQTREYWNKKRIKKK